MRYEEEERKKRKKNYLIRTFPSKKKINPRDWTVEIGDGRTTYHSTFTRSRFIAIPTATPKKKASHQKRPEFDRWIARESRVCRFVDRVSSYSYSFSRTREAALKHTDVCFQATDNEIIVDRGTAHAWRQRSLELYHVVHRLLTEKFSDRTTVYNYTF